MEKSSSEKVKLGIFVIIGTALLLVASYLIGNRQNMFGDTLKISAVFKNINGLQGGNNVRFSGINVGTVRSIQMVNDTTIRVHMVIEKRMQQHIRTDAIATIGSDGLVGSMIVNINPGRGKAPLVESGDEILSYSRVATEDMLSTLNVTNENAALLTADLLKFTQSLNNGKGVLWHLLHDTAMSADLKLTMNHVRQLSQHTNESMEKLSGMLNNLDFENSVAGVLLTDTVEGNKIRAVIANLDSSAFRLGSAINGLDAMITNMAEGDGAISYLTNDSNFVRDLEQSLKNIEQGTERFNQNMDALKNSFLFRRYFRRLEREGESQSVD